MHKLAYGVALVATATALAMSAAQAKDLFAGAYGNTVVQTMPNGMTSKTYINPDHTWEQMRAGGKTVKGTYTWKDAHTACFTVTDPTPKDPAKATNCTKIKGTHKAGDNWTVALPKNMGVIKISIVRGRSG